MKKIRSFVTFFSLALVFFCGQGRNAQAAEQDVIKNGIYAEDIELSGLTKAQATTAVEEFIAALSETEITLVAAQEKEVTVTAADLGIAWANPELVDEALQLGKQGNVIERYKAIKDLEHENKIYEIELSFDLQAISDLLTEKCAKYDVAEVNVSLKRAGGSFEVVEGQTGYTLDVEKSIDLINNYLTQEWDGVPCRIELDIAAVEPKGSAEELAAVKDVLGTYTTSYKTSGTARSANIANGCALINGTTLYPGEEFDALDMITPFTEANGYYMAGSYLNGKVVDSLGGGICQVSTTLYNAVLLSELEVTERYNHSMIISYVQPSMDAAIAENGGKNFKFVNNTEYPIYIEGTTSNKTITFTIYGKETRDVSNRKVTYESEVLEVINPEADTIYADASQPIGYIITESAHIGYKARLWKIVTENGVEVSREQVNSSSYKMVPRSATVGTATSDPTAAEQINAAIATANIDYVKGVIAQILSGATTSGTTEE